MTSSSQHSKCSISFCEGKAAFILLDHLEASQLAIEISEVKPHKNSKDTETQTVSAVVSSTQQVSSSDTSHLPGHISFRPLPPNSIEVPEQYTSSHPMASNSSTSFPVQHPTSNQKETSYISPPHYSTGSTILLYPAPNSNLILPDLLSETITSKDFNLVDIKLIRGNGLAVTLQSQKDIVKLTSKIEENSILNSAITPKFPGKRNPSIPSTIKEEAIQEALKSQLHLANPLNPRFNFKGSSPNSTNWVFEAPATILNTILQSKKILIGWRMFPISEFYHLKKCNFCQAFGHTTKDCTHQLPSCSTCAGHHPSSNCQSSMRCCVNCYESNLYSGIVHKTSHSAKDLLAHSFRQKS
ncbi:hypothetical protein AVEN_236750-1 [Araneus ventricosus]|uniref:CCHC-type domain-containing protein n=1 Tax=Araneus ventricosus TaxID=182803 RepID=A0A4Y2JDF0_ARAVE|nr:hypothetical protein AVEN_236750-1 [Araneus ventricosus]